ncbi:MAG: hypothetical protein Ct9H300mP29_6410 [Candidatus Neomarinimicrobiota bacterium]|nr:MAG: hypothetical protein Ct9H300mP29_6410 [Candidatus Neomarinimicrobiota bacterium]
MLLRNLYIIIIVPIILLGQGPMNGYGIGNFQSWQSPSQGGMVSLGLTPSFQNGVSLSNPSTWQQLKYTHLSISYYGFGIELERNECKKWFFYPPIWPIDHTD